MFRLMLGVLTAALTATASVAAPAAPLKDLPDGLVGEYYAPAAAAKGPMVLVLGGSEGAIPTALARALKDHGYGALALGYFKQPGLPATLQSIPLEYFDRGVAWLAGRPERSRPRVAIVGVSKGAEAALLVGSRNGAVCAVVSGVGADVSWAGVNMQNLANPGPSWSVAGQPVAYVPYDMSGRFTSLRDLYDRSWAKAQPHARIPVEKIRGPVLLVSGKADALWPSTPMSSAALARLDAARFRFRHEHLAYDDAGHLAFGVPVAPGTVVPQAVLQQAGGTAAGNIAARADSWPKALAFLERAFQTGCR